MLCKILKDFKGSQDGMTVQNFVAGEEVEISDYLMSCIDKSWIETITAEPEPEPEPEIEIEIENKAITTSGKGKSK